MTQLCTSDRSNVPAGGGEGRRFAWGRGGRGDGSAAKGRGVGEGPHTRTTDTASPFPGCKVPPTPLPVITSSLVGRATSAWAIRACRHSGLMRWETETHDLGLMLGMMKAVRVPLLPSRT